MWKPLAESSILSIRFRINAKKLQKEDTLSKISVISVA